MKKPALRKHLYLYMYFTFECLEKVLEKVLLAMKWRSMSHTGTAIHDTIYSNSTQQTFVLNEEHSDF